MSLIITLIEIFIAWQIISMVFASLWIPSLIPHSIAIAGNNKAKANYVRGNVLW